MHGEETSLLEVDVRDTGSGIPKALEQDIFQRLVSTKPKGVGLGLALVFMIVETHGGSVEMESEEGSGSLFRVMLSADSGSGDPG